MATSLSQQLQRLAAPQSSIAIADARSRASILFEPKEAATKDRRTIYDIGVSGLQELITINPDFKQFERTLFDEATINLERAVEHSDVNELLNLNIAKFMRHLSPYLQLRPAHMCFEWLLRRFQVHEYNRNDVMALILPYHETSIFISIVQTMRLKHVAEWDWLRSIAKRGVPLPKSAIVNRAATLPAFLKFVCKTTLAAVTELGARASLLQTQLNFFTTVVVGALQRASPVAEWHISTLLEPLLRGLSTDTVDFVSSSYIIIAQLITRAQLKPRLCNALVERVANCGFERLRTTALMLLILIFDTQTSAQPALKPETLLNMVRQKWLTSTLAALAKDNIATQALCKPLLRDSVKAIQEEHAETNTFKQFLERLLSDIEFSNASAESYINDFLNAFVAPKRKEPTAAQPSLTQTDVIELDSDEEMHDVSKDFQSWYSDYLYKLERQYPAAFDSAIKRALQARNEKTLDKNNKNRTMALKIALAYRLKSTDENATSIYESLYHYNPEIRLHAIQTLFRNLQNYQTREQNYQLLKECLADRINDECAPVVAQVLKLDTKDFIEILGAESFTAALFNILYRAQQLPKLWQPLIKRAVEHLTSSAVYADYDKNLILLALMPIVFPDAGTTHVHAAILEILKSDYCGQVEFLRALEVPQQFEEFNVSEYKKHFLNVIAHAEHMLSAKDLLRSVEARGGVAYMRQAVQVTHLLLLLTACLKQETSAADSLTIFKQIVAYSKAYKIKDLAKHDSDTIPLQLYSDFVNGLIEHTEFGDLTHWTTPMQPELQCALYIYDALSTATFAAIQSNADDQLAWTNMLKACLDAMLPTAQLKIDFLSNFYMYEALPCFPAGAKAYTMCRVRAFKLLQAVLANKSNDYKLNLSHILRLTCALTTPMQTLRLQTLETLQLLAQNSSGKLAKYVEYFLSSIVARTHELGMDQEQFALILYTILQPHKVSAANKMHVSKLRRELLQLICDDTQPAMFTAALLHGFKHVNDVATLTALLPLANETLKRHAVATQAQYKQLPAPYNEIYRMIVERFDLQTVKTVFLDEPLAWQLFELSFAQYDVYTLNDLKLQPLPCVILETFTPEIYEALPEQYKQALIQLIVQTVAQTDNDSIFLAAHKLLKRCTVDCRPFVATLQAMCKQQAATNKSQAKSKARKQPELDVTCLAWKQGISFLELLEHKRNLLNSEALIPALFDVLKACLELDEQSAVEYPKQLLLSTLLHCCQSTQTQLRVSVPESSFHIEQVVQCLRATQNPQTQQIALLFLTHCATLYPQQVLHNIVAIFTFMGSSVVRHDDAFSFHIINKVIEQIVPILIAKQKPGSAELVIPVLKVFSDIMLDVPEHRRLPLYTKFLQTLGPVEHLWQFLCVVFEAHVAEHEKQRLQKPRNNTKDATKPSTTAGASKERRLEIAQQLANVFEPQVIVETCVQLLNYLLELPATSTERGKSSVSAAVAATELSLFDVKSRNATQLRHYKYIIMQFLSNISSSNDFLHKVAQLSADELLQMKPYYQNFIIKTLSYIAHINTMLKTTTAEPILLKVLKVILNHAHDVLDNAISLLSPEMFLLVVNNLMQHELPGVRKKVIELLIAKLQNQSNYFDICTAEHFTKLFEPLTALVESINKPKAAASTGTEQIYIQQTALIAIKLLSKLFGQQYIDKFKALLVTLTEILKERANCTEIVVANVVLTLVEISANLKAHSLAQLPKFMPHIMDILQQQVAQLQQKPPDHVCLAITAGVQKLFEALPLFLGPYIVRIIKTLANISLLITNQHSGGKDQCASAVQNKIKNIWSNIATKVPIRILAPSCQQAYEKLLAAHNYEEIGLLMQLLLAAIKHNSNAELATMQTELSEFFLQALEYRLHVPANQRAAAAIESDIIDAFVAWILKLSETTFRPMYSKVYDWAFKSSNAQQATMLTYFLLTQKMAEALKSLFVLFASDFIGDAARLLDECNTLKQPSLSLDDPINVDLIAAILGTLYHIFLHDSNNFVNAQRFGVLVQPIVDQLENVVVQQHVALQEALTTCIAQLAVAVASDIQWKQLNYLVLMKTRANEPAVRIHAFNCSVEIARKLGEDYSTLLPETVPFIAELLEDEHDNVEKSTKKAVQELEQILGETLQKYL